MTGTKNGSKVRESSAQAGGRCSGGRPLGRCLVGSFFAKLACRKALRRSYGSHKKAALCIFSVQHARRLDKPPAGQPPRKIFAIPADLPCYSSQTLAFSKHKLQPRKHYARKILITNPVVRQQQKKNPSTRIAFYLAELQGEGLVGGVVGGDGGHTGRACLAVPPAQGARQGEEEAEGGGDALYTAIPRAAVGQEPSAAVTPRLRTRPRRPQNQTHRQSAPRP